MIDIESEIFMNEVNNWLLVSVIVIESVADMNSWGINLVVDSVMVILSITLTVIGSSIVIVSVIVILSLVLTNRVGINRFTDSVMVALSVTLIEFWICIKTVEDSETVSESVTESK